MSLEQPGDGRDGHDVAAAVTYHWHGKLVAAGQFVGLGPPDSEQGSGGNEICVDAQGPHHFRCPLLSLVARCASFVVFRLAGLGRREGGWYVLLYRLLMMLRRHPTMCRRG